MTSPLDAPEDFPDDDFDEEGPEPAPEEVIPLADEPVAHTNWMCSGVSAVNLKKKAPEPHMMPVGSSPDQPTTDASGKFMSGGCPECGTSTIWKKVTL